MSVCRKCSVTLVEGTNCYSLKNKDYICKPCRLRLTNTHTNWKKRIKGVYGLFEGDTCLYVGESSIVNNRISQHKTYIKNPSGAKQSEQSFYFNLQQYDITFRILEECDNHKEREQYYINNLKPTYNGLRI
jgi:hypothetical protein